MFDTSSKYTVFCFEGFNLSKFFLGKIQGSTFLALVDILFCGAETFVKFWPYISVKLFQIWISGWRLEENCLQIFLFLAQVVILFRVAILVEGFMGNIQF